MFPELLYHFEAPLRMTRIGKTTWYLVSVPTEISAEIKDAIEAVNAPWGMISIWATLGDVEWKTILFPKKGGVGYELAINAKLRKRFHLDDGDVLALALRVPIG